MKKALLAVCVTLLASASAAAETTIDLSAEQCGVETLHSYSGDPDPQGIMERFRLTVPSFRRAVYYRGQWWPYAGNRVTARIVTEPAQEEGGVFLLLENTRGDYLAVLPLCGGRAYSFLAPDGTDFILKFGTHGKASIEGDFPVVAWAHGENPYEACQAAWKLAADVPQLDDAMKLRGEKAYPEVFRYLGWCSWEEFKGKITSDLLVEQLEGLESSPAPVRYLLVDDGHFDRSTLAPSAEKFPRGYKPLTDARTQDGIRWIGMWYALMGNAPGMASLGDLGPVADSMMAVHNGRIMPRPDAESIESFLRYMFGFSKRDGIDFLKIDFYGGVLPRYAGTATSGTTAPFPDDNTHAIDNPVEATVTYARVLQRVVEEMFGGLINCNWHQPQFYFHAGNSSVGRCSADYKKGNLEKAKSHLYDSYAAIPWLGQIAWGDHDMFHSNDAFAGRMMAISKALSGGPVYLSDPYDYIDVENVRPLCYEDGLLLRPIAPASPLPEDIFHPVDAERLWRVMAPLANRSVAVAVYNFQGDAAGDNPEFTTVIQSGDYRAAGGMVQPYSGDWQLPAEGLVVYDWSAGTATRLKSSGYPVSIRGFGDRLLQLSSIENGWAVIGRTDKYLPAAAVESVTSNRKKLTVALHESGPLSIWLDRGTPHAAGVEFADKGGGLYVANLPVEPKPLELDIQRK